MKMSEIEAKLKFIQNGGDITKLTSSQIIALQEYALDIKDLYLYDELQKYWTQKNFKV